MKNRAQPVTEQASADPYSGSSLVPMLIAGLVLTLIGMVAAVLLTQSASEIGNRQVI